MGKHKTQTRSTKSINEDIILPPPKGFRGRPPKPTRAPPLPPNDGFNFNDDIFQTENTSLGKFKIVASETGRIRNSKATQMNSELRTLKNWTTITRSITRRAERASNLTFSKCLHLVDLNNPRILMTHHKMAVTANIRA